MADEIKFGIGAEDTGFGAKLEEIKAQSAEAAESIKASFESINETFEKVRNTLAAFTAVLAGGEMFKEMISSTVEATVSSVALGRQLGISVTEASQLKVAMASVFVTQDQVTNANQKITMALKKNESAFTDLGVATRDSNGNFRNAYDIQLDVNEALMKFKEGTDRNVEGVKIYGRGWQEAQATLRITTEALAEAKVKADALGLTVGVEGKAATERYRKAMEETQEVLEGVGRAIGTALLPALSFLGEWFSEKGPELVIGFHAAMFALSKVFIEFKGVITNWVDSIAGSLDIGIAYFERFKAVATAALTPGASIATAWDKATKHITEVTATAFGIIADDAKNVQKEIADAMDRNSGAYTKIAPKDEGDHSPGGDEKKARLLADLAGELEAKKAAWATDQAEHGTFIQFSLEQERAFWESKTGLAKAGSTDAVAIQKDIDKLTVGIAKNAYDQSVEALKAQEAAYKNNLQAKLAIAVEMQQKIATAEGGNSKQALQAGAAVVAIEREIKAQQLAIDEGYAKSSDALELSKIDAAEREAALEFQLGKTTDGQMLAQDQSFEDQRYQLKVAALQRKLALQAQDPMENVAKIAQTNQEILSLQIAHEAAMDKIRIKSVMDSNKEYKALFASMQSGFQSTISSFLKGTASLAATVKGLFADVGNAVADSLAKVLAQQIVNTITGDALSKSSSLAQKEDAASVAAGNAWKSAAAIPYIGWALGPIEAAAAYAGVMAFGSAEGGYDIPAGVNPIMQTHEKEMILPAKHADVIRGLADNSSGSGGGGGFSPTIQVSAMDGPGFVKWMNQNAGPVAASLHRLNSRFMAHQQ